MNTQFLASTTLRAIRRVGCGCIAVNLVWLPIFAQPSTAEIQVKQSNNTNSVSDGVNFYCGTISDTETGSDIPTTLAYVPQRRANIPIVAWKSNDLAAWSPKKRCQQVSAKFQTFYQDGRLNYLADGESAGYSIICALIDQQQECSGENQLFQLRTGSNAEDVIAGLKAILKGNVKDTVIYQNSGNRTSVSVSGLLENAPAVEADSITK